MKAKIIIRNEDYEKEFKVRRMNYEEVILNYPTGTGLKTYKYNEIDLISEGEVDDFLISNKYFLQIKLNRGISVFLYKALKESIEEEINEGLNEITLLRDKYNVNGRGIWEKEIICVANDNTPIEVRITGKNFRKEGYSIIINKLEKTSFLQGCKEEINKILIEIKRKEQLLSKYGKVIEGLINTRINKEMKYL